MMGGGKSEQVEPASLIPSGLGADSENIRSLRRIDVATGETGLGDPDAALKVAVAVDVETTGLRDEDKVIELAMRRFRYDDGGRIVEIGRAWSWREDPGEPLSVEVIRLTGITDQDLAGRRIDDRVATGILAGADLVIAHNAAFDRPRVEARLAALSPLRWACSCSEIDWRDAGFEGRSLGWLCAQAGFFFDAHRAEADVDAVITLLRHERPDGRTLMWELDDNAARDSHLIEAVGAAYGVKEALRLRGYRWNPRAQVWWREVPDRDLMGEEFWLATEVYAAGRGSRGSGPRITPRTAYERHR